MINVRLVELLSLCAIMKEGSLRVPLLLVTDPGEGFLQKHIPLLEPSLE